MKKFELTKADVSALLIKQAGMNRYTPSVVNESRNTLQEISKHMSLINSILDTKYNAPREAGKRKHSANALYVNNVRVQRTEAKIKHWYIKNLDNNRITLAAIAKDTGLHINTVRYFLKAHAVLLRMQIESLAGSAGEIMRNTFNKD